jgi:S-adenosylmethionine/arginine decarboxylase-like enzyme
MKQQKKEIWSLDLAINLYDCDKSKFTNAKIKKFADTISEIIDEEGANIVGIINDFGQGNEEMEGYRLIHENQNSMITAHFVKHQSKAFINVHSCQGYSVYNVIEACKKYFETESYWCQKIFREYEDKK